MASKWVVWQSWKKPKAIEKNVLHNKIINKMQETKKKKQKQQQQQKTRKPHRFKENRFINYLAKFLQNRTLPLRVVSTVKFWV